MNPLSWTAVALAALAMSCGAALAAASAQPKACQFYLDACLYKVNKAKEIAAKAHGPVDKTFYDPLACYHALDHARAAGVWPAQGPYAARACVN